MPKTTKAYLGSAPAHFSDGVLITRTSINPLVVAALAIPALILLCVVGSIFVVTRRPAHYDSHDFEARMASLPKGKCHIPGEVNSILDKRSIRETLYPILTRVARLTSIGRVSHEIRFGPSWRLESASELHRQHAALMKVPAHYLNSPVSYLILLRLEELSPLPSLAAKPPQNLSAKSPPGLLATEGFGHLHGYGRAWDVERGLRLLRLAARRGEPLAIRELGLFHADFHSLFVDEPSKYYRMTRMAAQCGDSVAMFNMGAMFDNGGAVTKDKKRAMEWWERAAEKKLPLAAYSLGLAYGFGSAPDGADEAKARQWYGIAARQGHIRAAINFNVQIRRAGLANVNDQFLEAPLLRGANAGIPYAIRGISRFYLRREQTHAKEALKWLAVSGEHHEDDWAAEELADRYRDGNGVVRDMATANRWYKIAAQNGSTYAAKELMKAGSAAGAKDSVSRKAGIAELRKLAEKGDPEAMRELAYAYRDGRPGVTIDKVRSVALFIRCAETNDIECIRNASHVFLFGTDGMPPDPKRAIKMLETGIAMSDGYSAELLATAFANGQGVRRDPKKAEKYFTMAANAGSKTAAEQLVRLYVMQGDSSKAELWKRKAGKAASH